MAEVCCVCPCHWGSVSDRWRPGVRVADPVEAAVACSQCQKHHSPALLSKLCANDPQPPDPLDKVPWKDPEPPKDEKKDDGEGEE